MGKRAYRSYWLQLIYDVLKHEKGHKIEVKSVVERTSIADSDIEWI